MNAGLITLIVISSIIGLVLIYSVSRLLFDFLKKPYYEKLCLNSYAFLNKYVGLFTIIVGEIGAGKTTFASGFTNYRTIYKRAQAQEKINDTLIKFYDVDFNRVNQMIDYLYRHGNNLYDHITNPSYIMNYVLMQRIHPESKKDFRTYEDVFGGEFVYKKTDKYFDLNSPSRFLNKEIKFSIYFDEDGNVVDEKGFLIDKQTFKKIKVYDDFEEFEYDEDGNLKFDEKFEPIKHKVEGNSSNCEPKRKQVFIDNGLSYIDGYTALRDYIKAYLALIKNNYVYFINRKFFSRVTNNYAKEFDEKLLDIKDSWIYKNYKIDDYSILFWDEVALSDKKSTNFQNYAKVDGGSDAFLRLVRQIGKETIDVVKTVQRYERVVLAERELITSVISIEERKEWIVSKFKYDVISKLFDLLIRYNEFLNDKIMRITNVIKHKDVSYLKRKMAKLKPNEKLSDKDMEKYYRLKERFDLKESKLRKFINKISVIKDKLFASSLLEYKGVIYFNEKDVGKDVNTLSKSQAMKFKVYFPIRYCYGSTDTYAYSIVGDYLSMRSIDQMDYYEDTSVFPDYSRNNREAFVAKILTKDSVKNEINKKITDKAVKSAVKAELDNKEDVIY